MRQWEHLLQQIDATTIAKILQRFDTRKAVIENGMAIVKIPCPLCELHPNCTGCPLSLGGRENCASDEIISSLTNRRNFWVSQTEVFWRKEYTPEVRQQFTRITRIVKNALKRRENEKVGKV